jgi:hypothetical protein
MSPLSRPKGEFRSAPHGGRLMSRAPRFAMAATAVLACLLLQACAPTLPKAVKPVGCSVDDATLALACAAPQTVRDGITYSDVLAIGRLDRLALLECQASLKSTVKILVECRRSINEYSQALDSLNNAIAGQGR